MKLGVFFIGSPRSGGLYQYSLCILDSLRDRGGGTIIFNLSGDDFPENRYQGCFRVSRALETVSRLKKAITRFVGSRTNEGTDAPPSGDGGTPSRSGGPVAAIGWGQRLDILFLRMLVKLNRVDLLSSPAPISCASSSASPTSCPSMTCNTG